MSKHYAIKERVRRKSEVLSYIKNTPGGSLATVPSFLSLQPTMGGVTADTVMDYITELLEEGSIYIKGGCIYEMDYQGAQP